MPELPEVETIARGLREPLVGRVIEDLRCYWPPTVGGDPHGFRRGVRGRAITDIRRHGKYLFLVLGYAGLVAVHLRMTGQLCLETDPALPPPEPPGPAGRADRHLHLAIVFRDSPPWLAYRDVRKFGRLQWVAGATPRSFAESRSLGVDALELSLGELEGLCRRRGRALKGLLLDQTGLAGVGNIYADEILFRCRLSPLRSSRSLGAEELLCLHETIGTVLREAIGQRGTTVSDYRGARGEPGSFQLALQVYGKAGQPCPRCAAPLQRRIVAGRSTHYCPACQPGP